MAADATLVKGAAAIAAAETAKTTGMAQGIAAGVAPVMAEWAKQKAEDKKLQKEMNQWSQRIEDQIITDDPALRDEAIKIRDQIATIATNKDLGRDDQRKQILKLRDDFVVSSGEFTRRKAAKAAYIKANADVGDNVSKAYDAFEGNEISKQLGNGSAKEVDGGWEFIIPARGNKEQYVLNVSTDELVNYAKKPADRATITAFQNLITSKNKQTEPGGEENSITSVNDSFNTLQKREILSEMEDSVYVPSMSEEEVDIAFKQHVTNNIRAEKDDSLGFGKENRAAAIAGIKRALKGINEIKSVNFMGNKLNIPNLPQGFSIQYNMYQTDSGVTYRNPVLVKGNQRIELDVYDPQTGKVGKIPSAEDVRREMINIYQDDIERYNIDLPLP